MNCNDQYCPAILKGVTAYFSSKQLLPSGSAKPINKDIVASFGITPAQNMLGYQYRHFLEHVVCVYKLIKLPSSKQEIQYLSFF